MKKKLEAELTSLAHSILTMKNKNDVNALKLKAQQVYEQLSVLAYIEKFVAQTPQNTKTVEELVDETFSNPYPVEGAVLATEENKEQLSQRISEANQELNEAFGLIDEIESEGEIIELPKEEEEVKEELSEIDKLIEQEIENNPVKEVVSLKEAGVPSFEEEQATIEESVVQASDLDLFTRVEDTPVVGSVVEEVAEENEEEIVEDTTVKHTTLEEEFQDSVSADVAADLFENAIRVDERKTINDLIHTQKNLQIDLNDRIAFVNHLFEGSQEDFNRVISQLNTMGTLSEAMEFVKMVKREYTWTDKEAYEERLYALIERKYN